MSLVDELLNESTRNLLFYSSDRHSLVNDLHPESRQLLAEELVAVGIWHVLKLLEGEIVKLHQFHPWEWLNIKERDTS